MSTTIDSIQSASSTRQRGRIRAGTFRVLSALTGLLFVVAFGSWRSILTPWVTIVDTTDHGWTRTPELHRLADSASAATMLTLGLACLLLAVRPRGRSGLAAWVLGTLTIIALGTPFAEVIESGDLTGGLITAAVMIGVALLIFGILHPEGRTIIRGGALDPVAALPAPARPALLALAAGGIGVTLTAVAWRFTGGIVESPQEDDVVSAAMLGMPWLLGAVLCLRSRAGWRWLAPLLGASAIYAVVATATITLG